MYKGSVLYQPRVLIRKLGKIPKDVSTKIKTAIAFALDLESVH